MSRHTPADHTGPIDADTTNELFTGATDLEAASSWMKQIEVAPEPAFDWRDPFAETILPVSEWISGGIDTVLVDMREWVHPLRWPIDYALGAIESAMLGLSPYLLIGLVGLAAWQIKSLRLAMGCVISLIAVGLFGVWDEAMTTLALVATSLLFCALTGLPLGIAAARSNRFESLLRPALDAMQTTPSFVYLVPIVMLFGIGNVPGVIVTVAFALPPLIRLTNLGIRQVPADLVEAARALGASDSQLLFRVQLPMALPTIMAGINQALMLALSMVVIASMIAVGGLGHMVLEGLGRLDIGHAMVGGFGIVVLAVVLDRLTQELASRSRQEHGADRRHWYETGPIGGVVLLTRKMACSSGLIRKTPKSADAASGLARSAAAGD